jgi:hypothetical protein
LRWWKLLPRWESKKYEKYEKYMSAIDGVEDGIQYIRCHIEIYNIDDDDDDGGQTCSDNDKVTVKIISHSTQLLRILGSRGGTGGLVLTRRPSHTFGWAYQFGEA